jgi:hypothetical protein
MLNAVSNSLSDLASSNDKEDGEDQQAHHEDTELCKMSKDDEPRSVMGKISNRGQSSKESFCQKLISLDDLTQLQWVDAADIVRKGDMTYGMAEFKIPAVVKLQMDQIAAPPTCTTFGELMETLDIFLGELQTLHRTTQPGGSDIPVSSGKLHSRRNMVSPLPSGVRDLSPLNTLMPVELIHFYLEIYHP